MKITHIDLFSGIGGFALAADRVFGEVEHIFCDNDQFCQEILKKHWPKSKIYGDIREVTIDAISNEYRTERREIRETSGISQVSGQEVDTRGAIGTVSLLTGGFPCQPFSQAGKRKGTEDDRFLWPEMLRVIREFSPIWVIAENVRGLLTQGGGVVFERVCTDLEAAGYEVQPIIIPAVAVGAPHRRDRVWFIAHRNTDSNGCLGRSKEIDTAETRESALNDAKGRHSSDSDAPNTESINEERRSDRQRETQFRRSDWSKNWIEVATELCRVDDGVPKRLDRNPRLKALGNAIVPQVAEEIMKTMLCRK
jgi:DNA (cytosine-5)-methyltransferase 1